MVDFPYDYDPPFGTYDSTTGTARHTSNGDGTRGGSWVPVDLSAILRGEYQPETADLFARSDGLGLLYRGRVNELHGEPESGKSLVAQAVCVAELNAGRDVVYIDYEDTAPGVVGRLLAMGADPYAVDTQLSYIAPAEPFGPEAARHINDDLYGADLGVAVIDGVTEALATEGLSTVSNDDVAKWYGLLARPLARTGAAVLLIDHVVKNAEVRGRWAVGGGHKLAAIDGASYEVKVQTQPAPGAVGRIALRSSKDRHGSLRAAGIKTGDIAAVVTIDSTRDGIAVAVDPPGANDAFKPTTLMQKVSEYLEVAGCAVSKRNIRDNVTGKNDYIDRAAEQLVTDGYAVKEPGDRKSVGFRFVKPYTEAAEPATVPRAPTVPHRAPEHGQDAVPTVPPVYGRGHGARSDGPQITLHRAPDNHEQPEPEPATRSCKSAGCDTSFVVPWNANPEDPGNDFCHAHQNYEPATTE